MPLGESGRESDITDDREGAIDAESNGNEYESTG
jgi:hypothetical protein